MFEAFYWSSVVDAMSKLPKEILIGGVAAYVVLDIHKRNCEVKIAVANAEVRKAEVELETEKVKHPMG